jgi:hypothetical protein
MATTRDPVEAINEKLRRLKFIASLKRGGMISANTSMNPASPYHRMIEPTKRHDLGDGVLYEGGTARLTFNARMRRLLGGK